MQAELREGLVSTIRGADTTQEHLVEQETRAQSQIGLLTSQVADLKAAMAIKEAEHTTADAARDEAKQGRRRLETECLSFHSTYAGEFSLPVLCFRLVIVPDCGSIDCLGLRTVALSDLEARTVVEQRAQEVTTELAALTNSRWAMCDVILGAGQGSTQLALRLDEPRHQVDVLISEGVHSSVLIALTSVGSHCDNVDYDAVGQGYSSSKSNIEILAISNSAARGVEVLVSKVPATTIHLQF